MLDHPYLQCHTLLMSLFVLFNENPRDHFNYKKKEISCKYFWDDGVKLNAYSEKSKFINEINQTLRSKGINSFYLSS